MQPMLEELIHNRAQFVVEQFSFKQQHMVFGILFSKLSF